MIQYAHPKEGYIFVLTKAGSQISRIKVKYMGDFKKRYERVAPQVWLRNGWIEEIEIGGNSNGYQS